MRKFAANYVLTESWIFLKNGMVYADDHGNAIRFIDTKGDLRETELLAFHNGIIIAGSKFVKTNIPVSDSGNRIPDLISTKNQFSLQDFIEHAKQLQMEFPEKKIPEIINEIKAILLSNGDFIQEQIPGIFLLSGVNLPELKFTPQCRLRKIF